METRDIALIKALSNGAGGASYSLPIASSTQLGGVQPVAKTDTMTQEVGVDADGALWTETGGGETWEDIVSFELEEEVNQIIAFSGDIGYKKLFIIITSVYPTEHEPPTSHKNISVLSENTGTGGVSLLYMIPSGYLFNGKRTNACSIELNSLCSVAYGCYNAGDVPQGTTQTCSRKRSISVPIKSIMFNAANQWFGVGTSVEISGVRA